MKRRGNSDTPDQENPQWSSAEMADAVTFNGLPTELQGKLRGRPKAAATKERITIRLSPEVLDAFRETGAGWQTRIDGVLKDWVMARASKRSVTRATPAAVAKRAVSAKR